MTVVPEAEQRPPEDQSEGHQRDRSELKGSSEAASPALYSPSELVVALGADRQSVSWTNKRTTLPTLLEKARNAPETTNKGSHQAIFPGRLLASPGPRRVHNIKDRSFLMLDFDKEVGGWTPDALPWRSVGFDTYSSRPEEPRLRVAVEFDRPVTPSEWDRVAAAVADRLSLVGAPEPDQSCLRFNQIAFLPERAPGVELRTWSNLDRDPLAVEELLAEAAELGVAPHVDGRGTPLRDPFTINGYVGAFNRAYDDLDDLIKTFGLPYVKVGDRWRHRDSRSEPGMGEMSPGWWYSHHTTKDPAAGHPHTAFDLVRIHKFGSMDGDTPAPDWEHGKSHDEMENLAMKDPRSLSESWREDFQSEDKGDGGDNASPAAKTPAPGGSGSGGPKPKLPHLAVRLRTYVEANFRVFPAGSDGRVYVMPKTGGRAELLSTNAVIRACPTLGRSAGTLSASAREAATVLGADAEKRAPHPIALRAHHTRDRIVLDLAQSGNTRCVIVTPSGWKVEDTPPSDVIFTDSDLLPLPDPVRGGHVDELAAVLRWPTDEDRWLLVKGWLGAVLFADMPRPMLALLGEEGSGKTTAGRFVASVVDPTPPHTLGSNFGKDLKDDETKALNSYVVTWDNLSTVSGDHADFLSRVVTGDSIKRRLLYSNTGMVSISYRRTGVLTGITAPAGLKADTLARLIPIQVSKLVTIDEETLNHEWERVHPRVLAGVLDMAVQVLAREGLTHNPHNLRMADYAGALWAIEPKLADAYAHNVKNATQEMADEDPFVQVVVKWLDADAQDGSWVGTATKALDRAGAHYRLSDGDGYWPGNARAFSHALTKAAKLLRISGVTVQKSPGGDRRLTFTVNKES